VDFSLVGLTWAPTKADEPKKKGPTALRTARAHGGPCSLFPKKPTNRKRTQTNKDDDETTKPRLFNAKMTTTIGTWNVRTLWKVGSLELLIKEMKILQCDIVGLSEVRREGNEKVEHDGYQLLYSGCAKGHTEGVRFLLSKTASNSLIECHPISSKVIVARFKGQGHDVTIVQAYAPTSDHSDDEVDDFYAR
jgi:hypothetical protein